MSNKMWDILVEHAKTCVLSEKLYVYYRDDVRSVGIVFNNIHELNGLIANGQYYASDSLSDDQKVKKLAGFDIRCEKTYNRYNLVGLCGYLGEEGIRKLDSCYRV